jgi:hypothetical protein
MIPDFEKSFKAERAQAGPFFVLEIKVYQDSNSHGN